MIKYVVTGAAGFIGSTLCQSLLRNDQNCMVYGIDNLNDAYDRNIKHWRLSELKQMKESYPELEKAKD